MSSCEVEAPAPQREKTEVNGEINGLKRMPGLEEAGAGGETAASPIGTDLLSRLLRKEDLATPPPPAAGEPATPPSGATPIVASPPLAPPPATPPASSPGGGTPIGAGASPSPPPGSPLVNGVQEPSPPPPSEPLPLVNGVSSPPQLEKSPPEVIIKKEKEEEALPFPKETQEREQTSAEPLSRSQTSTPKAVEEQEAPTELSRKRSAEKEPENDQSSGSESDSSRKRNKLSRELETRPAPPNVNLFNGTARLQGEDDRERAISEFLSEVSVSSDSINDAAESLTKEIESLSELAAAKEMEWNAILRVKKLKEEMLERVLRRKRINHFEMSSEQMPDVINKAYPGVNQLGKQPNLMDMRQIAKQMSQSGQFPGRPILPKPINPPPYSIGQHIGHIPPNREGRNGPVIDVKSLIDEYRMRHPAETSGSRRGRRGRGAAGVPAERVSAAHLPPDQRFPSINPSLISMANLALGTGASVRTVVDPYLPISKLEQSLSGGGGDLGSSSSSGTSPRAKENRSPGQKPYPEVTLHPVSPPSLLHQVLTKSAPARHHIQQPPPPAPQPQQQQPAPQQHSSYSPTLARLLTAPDRPSGPPPHFRPPVQRVSIAEILSSTKKSRNEITITPVAGNPAVKKEEVVLVDEEDAEGGDRLVIDEGGTEDVPVCQGCRGKAAQFVCAGCGNQWYCSRECQVSAWEEHSDMCSG